MVSDLRESLESLMVRDPRLAWLTPYLRVQAEFDPKIEKLLRDAASDAGRAAQTIAQRPGIGARVRVAQLTSSRSAMMRALRALWTELGRTIAAGQARAQAAALEASFSWDEVLLNRTHPDRAARESMLRSLLASADRNVEIMIARALGVSQEPLSARVYRSRALSEGWLDRRINSALGRGASPTEIARVVRDFIRPDVPGGVAYAAKRLARTEINNAYHAQSIAINSDKPWNDAIEWKLSRSHPEPDECDLLAKRDQGLGRGAYPKDAVPKKPHPQCFCYIVPKTVSEAEFNRQFAMGAYNSWMSAHYGPDSTSTAQGVA